MPGYIQFFRGQFSEPPIPTFDLTGRTILVTGANSGLGLDAAKLLVRLNCSTIILVCRSIEKGNQAKQEVQLERSKNGQKPTIALMELDMASVSSIITFAERCQALPRIDAVLLNAGVFPREFSLVQGYERAIWINVVTTFFLVALLVPILRRSAQNHRITPNIAITGSAVHFWANDKSLTQPAEGHILETLSDPKQTNMVDRYNLSKLSVMLLGKYLGAFLAKSEADDRKGKPLVAINNVAPGLCVTNLFQEHQGLAARITVKVMARPSEHGARTLVYGAAAPGRETNAQYLSECQIKKYSPFVHSKEGDRAAEKLWKELGAVYENWKPGCMAAFGA